MATGDEVSIFAVGDLAVTRSNPESAFACVASVLNEPDILFGQLEATLSQKGTAKAESAQRPAPTIGAVLKAAGFDVLCNFKIDPEWGATYPFPADARKTLVAKCLIANKKIQKVSFLPALISKLNQPQLVGPEDENFGAVVDYVNWACADQNLRTKLSIEDHEVVIRT